MIYILMGALNGLLCFSSCQSDRQKSEDNTQVLTLANPVLELDIHREGGALVGLRFDTGDLNPFSWSLPVDEMPENNRRGAPFRGHFICLNRWGSPTEEEMDRGIPHNGEASNVTWNVIQSNKGILLMDAEASMEKFRISRSIKMDSEQAIVSINEEYTSLADTARPFMLVQHATFGTPFLDSACITNSNAGPGFLQENSKPDPESGAYSWPGTKELDLRRSNQGSGFVSTHLVQDSLGWCTLASPNQNFLVGYLWDAQKFPWLHIWHGVRDGLLWARGIEFGNTGLGDNYSPEERYGTRTWGVSHSTLLQPGGTLECNYLLFAASLPEGFLAVKDVQWEDEQLLIHVEASNGISVISMNCAGDNFKIL